MLQVARRHAPALFASFVTAALALVAAPAARAADPCPLTDRCVANGFCSERDGRCALATDADCQQSTSCQLDGQCAFQASATGGTCVAREPCRKTPACKAYGLCEGAAGDTCHPTDEACAASRACVEEGRCRTSSGPASGCVPDSCGEACTREGACEVVGEYDPQCVVATTKACMDSRDCARFGACQKHPDGGYCRATEGGCKRSAECRAMGLCTLPEGTFCQAITDDDCAQAEACTKHGACKAWAGICVSDLAGSDPLSPICDAVEITGLTASASSEHKATPPYHFEASQLVDRDRRTSWQPDSKKGGVGEVITLKLPAPARLARLDVANGFQLRDMLGDLFAMNNRAARVLVRAGGVTVAATLPADGRGFAPISLPPVSTDKLTIEILTVEKGWRWNDLALTELRVYSCR